MNVGPMNTDRGGAVWLPSIIAKEVPPERTALSTRAVLAWTRQARGGPDHPLARPVTHRGSPGARWSRQHVRFNHHHAALRGARAGTGEDHRGVVVTTPKEGGLELRLVVPREILAGNMRVEYVSQQNVAVVGLGRRQFLELLRRPDAPRVIKVGKLRLVRREDMLAFLDRVGQSEGAASVEEMDGADKVLEELGCSVRPRRR